MMKNVITVCLLLAALSACKEGDKNNFEIVSHWKLVEVLADPGDGSGEFEPVESEKIVVFYEDGRIVSNGNLCNLSTESEESTEGEYSEATGIISISDCREIIYEIDGSVMTLTYQCIEGCQARYVR